MPRYSRYIRRFVTVTVPTSFLGKGLSSDDVLLPCTLSLRFSLFEIHTLPLVRFQGKGKELRQKLSFETIRDLRRNVRLLRSNLSFEFGNSGEQTNSKEKKK